MAKEADDPLGFIQRCVRERKLFWTYHVNMRLERRHISRDAILNAVESYTIIEEETMKCRVCGGAQERNETDLPFKTGDRTIVVIKRIPVYQCERCAEYSLDDPTFARVEELLSHVGDRTELEIISFAA